jgi:hypothetical protein
MITCRYSTCSPQLSYVRSICNNHRGTRHPLKFHICFVFFLFCFEWGLRVECVRKCHIHCSVCVHIVIFHCNLVESETCQCREDFRRQVDCSTIVLKAIFSVTWVMLKQQYPYSRRNSCSSLTMVDVVDMVDMVVADLVL